MIETLKLMNRPANERLIKGVAEEVCVRTNSKALLEGSIAAIGDHYLITLKAMNCHSGDTVTSVVGGGGEPQPGSESVGGCGQPVAH